MATPSFLISMIQSVLHSHISYKYPSPTALKLRIGLRNIKVHLVCVRNLGDADKHAMQSLFSRIQDGIGRVSTAASRYDTAFFSREPFDDLRAVNRLAKEVNDECASAIPDHLTLDDVVEVADALLHNTADFCKVVEIHNNQASTPNNLRDVMDEFEVRARFLRDFLLFTERTGAEIHQIQNLLIHNNIRPFLRGVAGAFQNNLSLTSKDWVQEVHSRFPRSDSLQVFPFCTQTLRSMSSFDRIDDIVLKDFLSSLISLLWHLLRYQRHHPCHSVNLKALYECLRLSRFILKHHRQTNSGNFGVLMRDSGIMICSLYLTDVDPQALVDLLQEFDVVKAQVSLESNSSLEENALDFGDTTSMEGISDGKLQIETASPSHEIKSTTPNAGFQKDEVNLVLDRLLRGSKQLRLVPITGMAGLGKTTFALKVYNYPHVRYHFHARAWCAISQVFDKKRVLLQLLNQIQPGVYSGMMEDDLAIKLRWSLKGKKYLIVLDDVWTPQVWESLSLSFPNDYTQSRIVLTSRLRAIVPHALLDEQPYFLRLRSENECLQIIEMKLLHLAKLSTGLRRFAKLCKGLPLIAVLVAGLLSTTVQEDWDGILNHLSSGGISGTDQCKNVLQLSYQHLPDDLKFCFIYLGVFPEDEEISAQNLIQLWMAEGFVAGKIDSFIEDVAREYLDKLIQRNLVIVTKKKSTGDIKTCRVHDLLHDFCLMIGKQKNIFHLLLEGRDGLSDFNEPCNLESRLAIHSSALHFKDSSLFCPSAHSMLLFTPTSATEECRLPDIVFIIQIYKHLRVLCADQMWCDTPIPSEIAFLTQLTYLSISYCKTVIPSSIGNLSNLETLIIKLIETGVVSLPHTIWNLQKLKYLSIITMRVEMHCPGFRLPVEDLENSPSLLELESICGVEFYSDGSMENQMRKFPNISSLKCNILRDWESMNKTVVIPGFLSRLKFLTLCTEAELRYQFDFGFAENIRKLTLKGFLLSREEIAAIGKLHNLEVLRLLGIVFFRGLMEMEEGEFSKLRILVFGKYERRGNLERWIAAGDGPLPCLEKLVFHGCSKLEEIPDSCLENSFTLEEIEVSSSSYALESIVRDIQETQKEFGNSIKVQIQHEE